MTEHCPCDGCIPPKRHIGCHTNCPDYIRWKKQLEEAKAIRIRENEKKDIVICSAIKHRKARRKRDRKP